MKPLKLINTFIFSVLITCAYSQEKVKVILDGEQKLSLEKNNIGDLRFQINTLGSDNLFMGQSTGVAISHSAGQEGYYNTSIGNFSLAKNTIGYGNTALGRSALFQNTIAYQNTGIGIQSLYNNINGSNNLGIGSNALYSNVGGQKNIAIGNYAMQFQSDNPTNFDGYNVAIGYEALKGNEPASGNTGVGNTAIGHASLSMNSTGSYNIGQGFSALGKNASGSNNVALGPTAAYENILGSDNIAIGNQTLYFNQNGNNNVAIGTFAGANSKGSGNIFIGNKAGELQGGTTSNVLYIDNNGRPKDSVLIYGEMDNHYMRMNTNLEVYGYDPLTPAIEGIKKYPISVFSDEAGVYGENTVSIGWGIGVSGKGNYYGVKGESLLTGVIGIGNGNSSSVHGVRGYAQQANAEGTNYGIRGIAKNGSSNFSLYGDNPGSGANDWAGYFDGKVNVNGLLKSRSQEINGNVEVQGLLEANFAVSDSVQTNKLTTGILGIQFSNGNTITKAIKMKYIIAVGGTYPSADDSNPGTNIYDVTILGEVKLFAGTVIPDGWAECKGQLLDIVDYQSLYALLGMTYGGDGINNFGLPDLRNAVPTN